MKTLSMVVKEIDGAMAAEMLKKFHYERQRPLNKAKVKFYAAEIDADRFLPETEITVAYVRQADGTLRGLLTNGQHRLWAQTEAKKSMRYLVREILCESEHEVALLYTYTDIQKKRSHGDAYRAFYLVEELGMTATQLNALGAAIKFIRGSFITRSPGISASELAAEMIRHGEAGGKFFELTAGVTNYMRAVSQRASTLSVALVTLEESILVYGVDPVDKFWLGAIFDDGLRVGDPRKAANTHLLTSSLSNNSLGAGRKYVSSAYSARYLAQCFGAYVEGREINYTKVMDASAPIRIAGSQFNG